MVLMTASGPITPTTSVEEMIDHLANAMYEGMSSAIEVVIENYELAIAVYFTYAIAVLLYRSLQEPESFWLYDVYKNPRREEIETAYMFALAIVSFTILSHIVGRIIVYVEYLLRPKTALSRGVLSFVILPVEYALEPYYAALSSFPSVYLFIGVLAGSIFLLTVIGLYVQVRGRLDENAADDPEPDASI